MSETVTELITDFLTVDHKCKQQKCKQIGEEFKLMKKFILYSNQLNIYYKNVLNSSDNTADNNTDLYSNEKQTLLAKIESEIKSIDQTFRDIISDKQQPIVSEQKKNPINIRCDLCQKKFSDIQLSTHLTEHLNGIFNPLLTEDTNNEISIESQISYNGNQVFEPLFVPKEIKTEPTSLSDNETNFFDSFDNQFGCEDTDDSDEEVVKQNVKKIKVKSVKTEEEVPKSVVKKPRKPYKKCAEDFVVICDECGKTCRNTRHLSHHLSRVHNMSKKTANNCHLCDFGNVTIQELKIHLSAEHNVTTNKWNFHCTWPQCEQVFRFRTALDKHFRTHTGDLLYKCDWPGCNIQLNKKWKFTEHMRTHTGEKPFKCHWPGCDKAFGCRSSYRNHILSHNKEKHVCYYPGCEKAYPFRNSLREHILNIHKRDERPFDCPVEGCKRNFCSKNNLKLHMAIHKDRPRYVCGHEGCERSFVEEKSLKKHMEIPHGRVKRLSNGRQLYRDYKCDWPGCEYEAHISTNLKIHKMRAHTGEKPEKCDYPGCNFAAVRKFELKVHMMKHTGELPYPCSFPNCSRRFKSQRALDTHINKTHSVF